MADESVDNTCKIMGENLKTLITRNNMSQKDLISAVPLLGSPSALSLYIKGERKMPPELVKALAQFFRVSTDYIYGMSPDTLIEVPDIHYVKVINSVHCGDPSDILDDSEYEYVPMVEGYHPGCFALRLEGDSMMPEFRKGDIIFADPNQVPQPGDYVVAQTDDNQGTFKKYRERYEPDGSMYFELVPLNPDFATINSKMKNITIKGVFMSLFRKGR